MVTAAPKKGLKPAVAALLESRRHTASLVATKAAVPHRILAKEERPHERCPSANTVAGGAADLPYVALESVVFV